MVVKITIGKKFWYALCALILAGGAAGAVWSYPRAQTAPETSTIPQLRAIDDSNPDIQKIREIAGQQGVEAAYEYIKNQYAANQTLGHDAAHVVGRLAYEKKGVGGFAVCDTSLGFGCYHGLFEALIKAEGPGGIIPAREGCMGLQHGGAIASCIHGIGHGVMGYEGAVDKAIQMCSQLAQQDRIYCFDGVYMEFFSGVMQAGGAGVQITEQNPWQYCLEQSPDSQSQCVRNLVIYMLAQNVKAPAVVAVWCDKLPPEMKMHCVLNYGIHAAQRANGVTSAVVDMCANFTATADRDVCVTNAAREFVFQNRPVAEAQELCQKVSSVGTRSCESEVDTMLTLYGKK